MLLLLLLLLPLRSQDEFQGMSILSPSGFWKITKRTYEALGSTQWRKIREKDL